MEEPGRSCTPPYAQRIRGGFRESLFRRIKIPEPEANQTYASDALPYTDMKFLVENFGAMVSIDSLISFLFHSRHLRSRIPTCLCLFVEFRIGSDSAGDFPIIYTCFVGMPTWVLRCLQGVREIRPIFARSIGMYSPIPRNARSLPVCRGWNVKMNVRDCTLRWLLGHPHLRTLDTYVKRSLARSPDHWL